MGFLFDQAQGTFDGLLQKTGRSPACIAVSADVLERLRREFHYGGQGNRFLGGVPVRVDPYLAPGTMLVLNSRGHQRVSVAAPEPEPEGPEFESIFD